jgi:hypothetical protein
MLGLNYAALVLDKSMIIFSMKQGRSKEGPYKLGKA